MEWRPLGESDPFTAGLDRFGQFSHREELRTLRRLLPREERVRHAVDGTSGDRKGLLVATDRRILFVSAGLVRDRHESVAYGLLRHMDVHLDRGGGTITMQTPEGAWVVRSEGRDPTRRFSEAVRDAIAKGPSTYRAVQLVDRDQLAATTQGPPPELVERLERLERMLEKRSITEPEYRVSRRRLLESYAGPPPRPDITARDTGPRLQPATASPAGPAASAAPRAAEPATARAPAPAAGGRRSVPAAAGGRQQAPASAGPPQPGARGPEPAPAAPAGPAGVPGSTERRPSVWPPLGQGGRGTAPRPDEVRGGVVALSPDEVRRRASGSDAAPAPVAGGSPDARSGPSPAAAAAAPEAPATGPAPEAAAKPDEPPARPRVWPPLSSHKQP